MTRRGASKLSNSRTVGTVGLALLLGSGFAWAGPPNPTASDSNANTAGGTNALIMTAGRYNTGFGYEALRHDTTGQENTAIGIDALYANTTGNENTAIGSGALESNTTGYHNTASGVNALTGNTEGIENTASGHGALFYNTTGAHNTASGVNALYVNTTGNYNTANGFEALFNGATAAYNTASGAHALYNNAEGSDNTASGVNALYSNTTGAANTATGVDALYANTTGSANTAFGLNAGISNKTGSNNTFVGAGADTNAGSYTNGTALGYGAVLTASNSIVLGNDSISRIYANVTTITAISDRRHKKEIRALDRDLGLDFIKKLKPVSYRFNNGDETERYGFIAQDLEQALPASLRDTIERSEPEHGLALIERQNDNDRTYRVSYGELTAPIIKAIQEQQQEIEAMRQQNADLRQALNDQAATFRAENDDLRHWIGTLKEKVAAAR
jgi:trimeric autotransporter adhesin